jgi:hypothetical protein
MFLSRDQLNRFWSKRSDKPGWPVIVHAHGWTPAEAELQRKAMLKRAGFDSLTLVDKLDGFTRVLKEMAILLDSIGGQLYADGNTRRVLEYKIRELASQITGKPVHLADAYWRAIAYDKFGLHYPANSAVRVEFSELADLSIQQLTQLRNTLADRLTWAHKKQTLADRKQRADQKKVGTTSTSSHSNRLPSLDPAERADLDPDNVPW